MNAAARRHIVRALSQVRAPSSPSDARIHLALSGGVDSSVAGFLLRERGWDVHPVVMRCWDADALDDAHASPCHDADVRAAAAAAAALALPRPLRTLDLARHYWTDVFDAVYLAGLRAGATPNPDLACNRHIKFGAFPARLCSARFATGHYARLGAPPPPAGHPGVPQLLAAADARKDQSYFLASVPARALARAVFPLGHLRKRDVRAIARALGLPAAHARSSRGLCFVGKRRVPALLARYLPDSARGHLVHAQSGAVLAALPHPAYAYTTGQRARIGGVGGGGAYYVVARVGHDVAVVQGAAHRLLLADGVVCDSVDWVGGAAPDKVRGGAELEYKAYSSAERKKCWVRQEGDGVRVRFGGAEKRVATGQAVVLYDGDVCLGAAWPRAERFVVGAGFVFDGDESAHQGAVEG